MKVLNYVPYTINPITGKCYTFTNINITSKKEVENFSTMIKYFFTERKIYQRDVNKQIKDFLERIGGDFWLDIGSSKESLINWRDGPIINLDTKNHINEIHEYVVDLGIANATFEIYIDMLSFTEVVAVYHELDMLGVTSASNNYNRVMQAFKIAIYQYLRATNWRLRRKVLDILNESPFNIDYKDLENDFIDVTKNSWKFPSSEKRY